MKWQNGRATWKWSKQTGAHTFIIWQQNYEKRNTSTVINCDVITDTYLIRPGARIGIYNNGFARDGVAIGRYNEWLTTWMGPSIFAIVMCFFFFIVRAQFTRTLLVISGNCYTFDNVQWAKVFSRESKWKMFPILREMKTIINEWSRYERKEKTERRK